ncbi:MAG: integrase family protein, partial [Verrucomicrobiaceae bacterium]|nr:integrase family protein [Verrucomicrobiaceae bacterium]
MFAFCGTFCGSMETRSPPAPRLQRQPNSPFWYADIAIWDAGSGVWKRKFKSTRVKDDGSPACLVEAGKIAQKIADIAWMAYQGAVHGWSVPPAAALVSDILQAAGLPSSMMRRVPVGDYVTGWIEGRNRSVSKESLAIYKKKGAVFQDWLAEEGRAKITLDSLKTSDLQRFWGWLLGHYAIATARLAFSVVARILDAARLDGILTVNPAEGIERNAQAVGDDDDSGGGERRPYTAEELTTLLKVCATWQNKGGSEWVTMVLVALCTAARLVDSARMGVEHLVQTKEGWSLHWMPRKTRRFKKRIEVPVVNPLLGHLQALIKKQPAGPFCPVLAAIKSTSQLSAVFSHILDAAAIGTKTKGKHGQHRDTVFHSLRHTLPTLLESAGVPESTIMQITGHTTKAMVRRYTHTEMETVRQALNLGLASVTGKKKP